MLKNWEIFTELGILPSLDKKKEKEINRWGNKKPTFLHGNKSTEKESDCSLTQGWNSLMWHGALVAWYFTSLVYANSLLRVWIYNPKIVSTLRSLLTLYLYQFSSVQSLSRVRLFVTPWIAACQDPLSITNSRSSPRLMSIESVRPFSHSHPLSSPSPPAPNPSQHQSLFQWVNSLHEVAKVLEFQL